jgi:hypothetical protein
MRWQKLLDRYSLVKRPTLRVVSPRVGTSVIPLEKNDSRIFFQYLTNKIHSLHFHGSEKQLTSMIQAMQEEEGFTIQKMTTSPGRRKEKMVLLHLKFRDNLEIRRIIKIG